MKEKQEARENNRGLWAGCLEEEIIEEKEEIVEEDSPQPTSECSCLSDIYNCGDFTTHAAAQSLFECCGVDNDVHRLDADKDGNACESLP